MLDKFFDISKAEIAFKLSRPGSVDIIVDDLQRYDTGAMLSHLQVAFYLGCIPDEAYKNIIKELQLKGFKRANLDNHRKVGKMIINDDKMAGEALAWQEGNPSIFRSPYLRWTDYINAAKQGCYFYGYLTQVETDKPIKAPPEAKMIHCPSCGFDFVKGKE